MKGYTFFSEKNERGQLTEIHDPRYIYIYGLSDKQNSSGILREASNLQGLNIKLASPFYKAKSSA